VLSRNHHPWAQSRLPPTLLILSSLCATLLPIILVTLSALYAVPSDLRTCNSETQWVRMFRGKDGAAIRSIQDGLHCCGFNSLHDRAWPFPSRENDARTCERTQGYIIPCAGIWEKQTLIAGVLSLVANVLNAIIFVSDCKTDGAFIRLTFVRPCS
jgi:hypothetical protein